MYHTFKVYRADTQAFVGSVSAQSAEQAVYRLLGGDYGRTDYYAEEGDGE